MRYTDEGETLELCRWTVDLGSLPGFQQNANNPQPGGFYTGELDLLNRGSNADRPIIMAIRIRVGVGTRQCW